MALYLVTIGNPLDDSTIVEVILSNTPLSVNNVPSYLINIDEDWGDYIVSVEVANIKANSWDVDEHNEMTRLIEQL